MTSPVATFCFVFCHLKRIDSMLPWIWTVIDHRGRQNVANASETHSAAPRGPLFCSYHILTSSVVYYRTNSPQHGILYFIKSCWNKLGPLPDARLANPLLNSIQRIRIWNGKRLINFTKIYAFLVSLRSAKQFTYPWVGYFILFKQQWIRNPLGF